MAARRRRLPAGPRLARAAAILALGLLIGAGVGPGRATLTRLIGLWSDDEVAATRRTEPVIPAAAPLPRRNLAYLSRDDPALEATDLDPRRYRVIDIHEHVLDRRQAVRLLAAMDRFGIQLSCLMGASRYTFTLDSRYGFEAFKENNEALLEIKREFPERFCVFVTIDPLEPGNRERLEDYVRRGADGLKLYLGHAGSTGHGPFHVMALDDARMSPIYAYADEIQLPVMLHTNLIEFHDELVRVMTRHPNMRVCIPHFGLHKNTSARLEKLAKLFERYPNLFSEISFGWHRYHAEGFEALARWRSRSKAYLTRHADRFMYATDMVLEPTKGDAYIDDTLRSYFQLLETRRFRFFREPHRPMHGLDLSDETLRRIYEETPRRFLMADASGRLPDRTRGALPVEVQALGRR